MLLEPFCQQVGPTHTSHLMGMGWVKLDFAYDQEDVKLMYTRTVSGKLCNLSVRLVDPKQVQVHRRKITANVFQDIFDPATQSMKPSALSACDKTLTGPGPFYIDAHCLLAFFCSYAQFLCVQLTK